MQLLSPGGINTLLPRALFRKPLGVLYIGEPLRTFAVGLVGIFEPIYLYLIFREHAMPIPEMWVLLYYALAYILYVPAALLAARFIYRLGFRFSILISFTALFLYYPVLFLARWHDLSFLFFALLLFLLSTSCFWPIYHIVFSRSSVRARRGEEVSRLLTLTMLMGALGPAAGGFLIGWFGYPVLFLSVLSFIALSFIPYFFLNIRESYDGLGKLLTETRRPENRSGIAVFAGEGVESIATMVLWPLFLFLISINYHILGLIVMVSLLMNLAVTLAVGRLSDRRARKTLLLFGAPLTACSWVLRASVISPLSVFLANAFAGSVRPFAQVPFSAYFYDRVARLESKQQWSMIFFREFALNALGRTALFLFGALFLALGGDFRILLLAAVPASLVLPLIVSWARQKEEPQ